MSQSPDEAPLSLSSLGWTSFFDDQLDMAERALVPTRVATVGRTRLTGISALGARPLVLPAQAGTADHAVGDWVLAEPGSGTVARRLERRTLLARRTEGGRMPQLIAANVDTLFIVTSCNEDLNIARLERYLTLANEAGTAPVIVLTKADRVPDPAPYLAQARDLQRDLPVVALNAKLPEAAQALAPWCLPGRTVALVGSSGVGKSSLLNTLAAKPAGQAQATGLIREADAKGRHTTTARSLHPVLGGGWVIDTPGMRTLHVSDAAAGLDQLFAEITELAPQCRFRDCTHDHEPGCAIQAALAAGRLDPARVARWRKLTEENRANTPVLSGPRGNRKARPPGKKY